MTEVELKTIKDKLRGCSQEQLQETYQFVVNLYKVRRSNEGFEKAQTMVAGTVVKVIGGIRPKSWIGTVATVVRPKQTKVLCKLSDGRQVTFPANVLAIVSRELEVKP